MLNPIPGSSNTDAFGWLVWSTKSVDMIIQETHSVRIWRPGNDNEQWAALDIVALNEKITTTLRPF